MRFCILRVRFICLIDVGQTVEKRSLQWRAGHNTVRHFYGKMPGFGDLAGLRGLPTIAQGRDPTFDFY